MAMEMKGKFAAPIHKAQRPNDRKSRTKQTRHMHLRLGRIVRVDYLNWVADIEWVDSHGARSDVPLSVGMGTHRAFSGFMPQENTIVVCGFSKHTQKSGSPVVLAYLPNGHLTGYDFNPIKQRKDKTQIRCRMQKVYPGEGFSQSTQGAWTRLDHHWQAYGYDLSGIWINAFTHSVNIRALNHVIRTAMGRTRDGLIIRNDHPRLPGKAPVPAIILLDQKPHKIVTVDDKTIDEGGVPWVEHRQLIRETTDAILDITEEFDDDDQIFDYEEDRDLHIERVLGTFVGDFPRDEDRYGRVLRFQVFDSPTAVLPTIDHVVITDEAEKKQLAEASHLLFIKSALYGKSKRRSEFTPKFQPAAENKDTLSNATDLNTNKEGKLQGTVGCSSDKDPLGEGRSVELNFDGSIKLTIGSNIDQEQSVVIDTASGWNIHINGPDKDGYAMRLFMKGNVYQCVDGNLTTEVTGNELHLVHKNRTVLVGGVQYRRSGKDTSDNAPTIMHN